MSLTVNPSYTGSGADTDLVQIGSTMLPDETAHIRVVATVTDVTDRGSGLGVYANTVTSSANGPGGAGGPFTDVSVAGTDPDPDGSGDPGDAPGVDDGPTAAVVAADAVIGIAKDASVSGEVVTFDFLLEHTGNAAATNISVPDDLDSVFGAGTFTVDSIAKLSGPATFDVDPSYTGSGLSVQLVSAGSSLNPGESAGLRVVVTLTSVTDQGGGLGVYANAVTSSANGPGGAGGPFTDDSVAGTDPDPDGSGDPGAPSDGASLRFSIASDAPATFRILLDDAPVFERTLEKREREHWWEQKPIDLTPYAGRTIRLSFEVERVSGEYALWGHPRITRPYDGVRPNLVVISIDCLRADHVGVYGYEKPTTPSIDAFAGRGQLFENAVSASSWTIPSHMSMFTGLPPMVHGVNDSPDNFWAGRATTLAPTVPYLAEILARNGYETAGVVSSAPMSPLYRFERGFGSYRVHAANAAEVVDSALDRIASARGRPFFLFVHFIDPHWPYMPLVEFRRYARDFIERFGERPRDISGLTRRHQGKAAKAPASDADDVRTLYDAALAYTDQELGRFFSELERKGLYDDALIVLTGDHGEAFYDHETFGHAKTVYQELTHVPLIVKWPKNDPTGRVEIPVSHVDIFPTLLEAAGISPPSMEGVSLRAPERDRSIVLDASWEDPERRETMLAVRRGDLKYIAYVPFEPFEKLSLQDVIREELFDVSKDPGEQNNLIDSPPVALAPFRDRLRAYMDAARVYRASHEGVTVEVDEQTRKSLEALGYVQ